jgi:hypothetical protein
MLNFSRGVANIIGPPLSGLTSPLFTPIH